MAQNIIYSSWEGPKAPWLCLQTKLSLFGLLWLFSSVSACSHSLVKLILWLNFSTDRRQAEDLGQGMGCGGKDHRVLLHFSRYSGILRSKMKVYSVLKNYLLWVHIARKLQKPLYSWLIALIFCAIKSSLNHREIFSAAPCSYGDRIVKLSIRVMLVELFVLSWLLSLFLHRADKLFSFCFRFHGFCFLL